MEENIFDLLSPQIPQDVTIEKVEGAKRAYQLLLNKQADFLITSLFAYETEMRRFKVSEFLTHSKTPLMSPVIFMTYADGNPCAAFIVEKLQEKLREYTSDETLMRTLLSEQVIAWENKFADQKSLMFEVDEEPEHKRVWGMMEKVRRKYGFGQMVAKAKRSVGTGCYAKQREIQHRHFLIHIF